MQVDERPVRTAGTPASDDELAIFEPPTTIGASHAAKLSGLWPALWPRISAMGLVLLAWQIVVWSHWRPDYVLPGPGSVLSRLLHDAATRGLWQAIGVTLERAAFGYALAMGIGILIGLTMVRVRPLRAALGSLTTGLQSMPSVAWFPLAILFFKLTEAAILFVVVLGAAPAIANGFVSGFDQIPPLVLRTARMLGAHGIALYSRVIHTSGPSRFRGWA